MKDAIVVLASEKGGLHSNSKALALASRFRHCLKGLQPSSANAWTLASNQRYFASSKAAFQQPWSHITV
eukprot:8774255-Lingulodinium_polyedra.AAC.1